MTAAELNRKNVKVNKPKIRQSWDLFLMGHPFSSFSDSQVSTNMQASISVLHSKSCSTTGIHCRLSDPWFCFHWCRNYFLAGASPDFSNWGAVALVKVGRPEGPMRDSRGRDAPRKCHNGEGLRRILSSWKGHFEVALCHIQSKFSISGFFYFFRLRFGGAEPLTWRG